MKSKQRHRFLGYCMVALAVGQLIVILLSWLLSAAMPDLMIHSLLSSEGIRWFFGRFSYNVATPMTTWLIVATIAYGCISSSGLLGLHRPFDFRQRLALRLMALEIVIFVFVLASLTLVPHAVLLSIDGYVFSDILSASIIPYVSFCACVASVSYALMSGKYSSVEDIFNMFCVGFRKLAPLFVFYVLATQLVCSVLFVFSSW